MSCKYVKFGDTEEARYVLHRNTKRHRQIRLVICLKTGLILHVGQSGLLDNSSGEVTFYNTDGRSMKY